jgi:hypothetical protein
MRLGGSVRERMRALSQRLGEQSFAYHPYTPGEQTSVGTLDELASLVEKHITSYAA